MVTDVVEIESGKDVNEAIITVTDKNSGRIVVKKKCSLQKGTNTIPVDFIVRNPRLWWCNGLGEPNLYTFSTQISVGNRIMAQQENRIGLRSVKLVTDPDADGTLQFYFVLNGVPVFAKGSNYIPQDNFLTNVTPERYRQTLLDATSANMNMIRVWGGGIYESDLFYDICDEMGLMVVSTVRSAPSVNIPIYSRPLLSFGMGSKTRIYGLRDGMGYTRILPSL